MADHRPISDHPDGIVIDLYVQPRASRTGVVGIHDGALRLHVGAPPVDNAANEAIVAFLAKELGVSKSDIEIIAGRSGRRKRVRVAGIFAERAETLLKRY